MKPGDTLQSLLALSRQFMESRILLSAAELNLFAILNEKPASADQLAKTLNADRRGLAILLDALTAMGLLSKREDTYRCAPDIAPFLTGDSPRSVLPMILHAAHLWKNWSDLTAVIQKTAPRRGPSARTAGEMRAFIGAMHVVGTPLAQEIVAAVRPGKARRLIDVGGASGTYTIAFLRAVPGMTATLFDRPEVVPIARERLEGEGMLDRVRLAAGNFDVDELPGGHDLALLSAIIHQNGPGRNVELFRKVGRALIPGGRIIIRDHVMSPGRTEPKDGTIFAVNMLVNTSEGSAYTFDEIRDWLADAGFADVRLLQAGKRMDGLVEAFKP